MEMRIIEACVAGCKNIFLGWGGNHYAKRSNKDYGKDFQ
jgi:hypothetical protein